MTVAAEDTSWDNYEKPLNFALSLKKMHRFSKWVFYVLAWKLGLSKWSFKRSKNFAMSSAIGLLKNEELSSNFDDKLEAIREWYKSNLINYHDWYLSIKDESEDIKITKTDLELARKILTWKLLMTREAIQSWTLKKEELAKAKELFELITDDLDTVNHIIKKITSWDK